MDRHTLYSLQGGLLLFLSAVLYFMFRARRRQRGDTSADWAAASYALAGTGMILQSYRGMAPPFVSIILGNGIFMLFGPCFNRAIAKATGARRDHFYLLLAFVVATMVNFWDFTYVHPNVMVRTLEAVAVMGVQYGSIVWLLLSNKNPVIRPAMRAIFSFFCVHYSLNLFRVFAIWRLQQADAWLNWFGVVTITGIPLSFLAIEGLRMSHELEERATTDPLTELLNRRGLEQMAEREQRRAFRHGSVCSALSMDINDFKGINDAWGHAAGDQALTAIASTLRATLRGTDVPARLGGDEFFVLLPESDTAAAHMAASRIRAALATLELKTFYGESFSVSVSIGVASAHGAAVSLAELMHASDILLYQDKRERKQRMAHATGAGALPMMRTRMHGSPEELAAKEMRPLSLDIVQ